MARTGRAEGVLCLVLGNGTAIVAVALALALAVALAVAEDAFADNIVGWILLLTEDAFARYY